MSEELVYLLQCGKHYKIGRTTNFEQRLKDIQSGLPVPIIAIHTWPTLNSHAIEQMLHKKFQHCRVRGEWFTLEDEEVHKLISTKEWIISEPRKPKRTPAVYESFEPPEGSLLKILTLHGISSPFDFSNVTGCSRQYASHIFRGRRGIGKDLALKLHAIKGIPFEDLLQATTAPRDRPKIKPGPKPGRPHKHPNPPPP